MDVMWCDVTDCFNPSCSTSIVECLTTMSMFVMPPCLLSDSSLSTYRYLTMANRFNSVYELTGRSIWFLLNHIWTSTVEPVQSAWLITGTRRRDHITPVLRRLHWLSVRQRVSFNLAVYVCQALHNTVAPYLVDDCQLVSNASNPLQCVYSYAAGGQQVFRWTSSVVVRVSE